MTLTKQTVNVSSMSSGHGPAKAPHLLYVGEGPPKNPRRRRRQGTLILPCTGHDRQAERDPSKAISVFLDAFGAVGSLAALHQRKEDEEPWPDRGPMTWMTHSRSVSFKGLDNDPSACSPTETLL